MWLFYEWILLWKYAIFTFWNLLWNKNNYTSYNSILFIVLLCFLYSTLATLWKIKHTLSLWPTHAKYNITMHECTPVVGMTVNYMCTFQQLVKAFRVSKHLLFFHCSYHLLVGHWWIWCDHFHAMDFCFHKPVVYGHIGIITYTI